MDSFLGFCFRKAPITPPQKRWRFHSRSALAQINGHKHHHVPWEWFPFSAIRTLSQNVLQWRVPGYFSLLSEQDVKSSPFSFPCWSITCWKAWKDIFSGFFFFLLWCFLFSIGQLYNCVTKRGITEVTELSFLKAWERRELLLGYGSGPTIPVALKLKLFSTRWRRSKTHRATIFETHPWETRSKCAIRATVTPSLFSSTMSLRSDIRSGIPGR